MKIVVTNERGDLTAFSNIDSALVYIADSILHGNTCTIKRSATETEKEAIRLAILRQLRGTVHWLTTADLRDALMKDTYTESVVDSVLCPILDDLQQLGRVWKNDGIYYKLIADID